MLAKYFLIIRNYVLSVSSQRKYNFYHQNTLLDVFRNIIGRNPWMVIPLLANQDLTPMLVPLFRGTFFLIRLELWVSVFRICVELWVLLDEAFRIMGTFLEKCGKNAEKGKGYAKAA